MTFYYHFLIFNLFFIPLYSQIQCYNCISQININSVGQNERNALKTALFSRYNIPASSEYCSDGGSDIIFKTVPKEICKIRNDTCVRIQSTVDDESHLVLTIRGCESTLLKHGYTLDDKNCTQPDGSKCVLKCDTSLCNLSKPPLNFFQLFFAFVLYHFYAKQ